MIDKLKLKLEKYSNFIIYEYENEQIPYGELYSKAKEYSSYLKKQGTEPIILLGNNEIDELIAIVSCVLAKRTYIPIGICTPIDRIKKIIELTGASLIITDVDIDANVEVSKLKVLNKFSNLEEKESSNDTAYIIFTSGSTGEPKGVPISYENLDNFINWISKFSPLDNYQNISVFNQASFSFDLSVASLYYSLFNGHKLVSCNIDLDNNYDMILDKIKEVNLMVITPTFIKLCLLDLNFNSDNYSKLDCIYFCGEKLENKVVDKLFKRFPDIKVINAYGPTEATSAISAILINKDMLNGDLPVGDMNYLATDVKIVENEIVLSGKSVSKGYINNYQGGFINGNYKTGDIGYIVDNYLYCKGRIDNQIKYKGYRIELGEIEYHLNNIENIVDAVVIPKYDVNHNIKNLKAFVVGNITEVEVKNELEKYLPCYMIPQNICITSKLPINQNGKIDRKKLMDL